MKLEKLHLINKRKILLIVYENIYFFLCLETIQQKSQNLVLLLFVIIVRWPYRIPASKKHKKFWETNYILNKKIKGNCNEL